MTDIQEKIKQLPPDLQREVADFVEFLLAKRETEPRKQPSFGWAGALEGLREKYTSVELQHQIAKWRIGGRGSRAI